MKINHCIILVLGLIAVGCTTEPLVPEGFTGEMPDGSCAEGFVSFEHEILPLITSNCAMSGCHDAITAEDDIILTDYNGIMKEVTPNDPNNSELYTVLFESGDDLMPPPPASPLTQAQKDLIKKWINQGAKNTTCAPECDSTQTATFAAVVYPIIEASCVGCHGVYTQDGNVRLDSYQHVKTYVDNGQLMGTINHLQGYSVMPPSGVPMTDCQKSLLQQWINNGAANN
jgi:uncharacterized membrane protein